MLRILCVACLLGSALGQTLVLNDMVDQLLEGLNQEIARSGNDILKVEDLEHDWRYSWHFVKLRGHVKCRDGYVRSLASLRRTGDVTFTTAGNRASLRLALGLGTLELGFDSCSFKARRLLSVTRKVSASASSNSIEAEISLTRTGNGCVTSVDKIVLADLGRIRLSTEGGVLRKIEGNILSWFTRRFHDKIVRRVNDKLNKLAKDNIQKLDVCRKIPF